MWKVMQLLQIPWHLLHFPGLYSMYGTKVLLPHQLHLKPLTWGFYGSTVTLYEEMQQQSITADWIWILSLATCHLVILE